MSDSDETVCNESGEENENTQNSPSILSNWRQDEAVFSPQNDEEKSPKNNLGTTEHEENRDIMDVDETVTSFEVSQEFPLITRGLKRKAKETFDGNGIDDANSDAKEIQSETNAISTESELNVSNINGADTQAPDTQAPDTQATSDEDRRLEMLLKTVEKIVRDMEIMFEREGNVCYLQSLQDAKSQLADVQRLLVESNRENQAKRKTVLSDPENSQQLDDEKKLVIVNLAKKQRKLLEFFQKYKSLVQRLKAMKDLKNTSQRTRKLSENSAQISSQDPPNPSTNSSKTKLLPSSPSFGRPPDRPVEVSSQNLTKSTPRLVIANATNAGLAKATKQGSVKFILLQNQSSNLEENLGQSSAGNKVSVQTMVNQSNTASMVGRSSSVTRQPTTRQCSAQSVPVQSNMGSNNTTLLSGANRIPASKPSYTTTSIGATTPSFALLQPTTRYGSTQSVSVQNTTAENTTLLSGANKISASKQSYTTISTGATTPSVQSVSSQYTNSENTAPSAGVLNKTTASKQSNARQCGQNMSVRQSVPQAQFTPSTTTFQGTGNRSGLNQNSSRLSLATNLVLSTPRQIQPLGNRLSTSHVTTLTTQSQNTHGPAISSNRSGTNQNSSQFLTKPFPRFPPQRQSFSSRSRPPSAGAETLESQSNSRVLEQATNPTTVRQTTGLSLSLDTLVKKGVLAPGQNVLTITTEDKLYSASLSNKGTIISAGGEGFTSPRSWVKAILGSKRKVKNELAWKMLRAKLQYEGQSST